MPPWDRPPPPARTGSAPRTAAHPRRPRRGGRPAVDEQSDRRAAGLADRWPGAPGGAGGGAAAAAPIEDSASSAGWPSSPRPSSPGLPPNRREKREGARRVTGGY